MALQLESLHVCRGRFTVGMLSSVRVRVKKSSDEHGGQYESTNRLRPRMSAGEWSADHHPRGNDEERREPSIDERQIAGGCHRVEDVTGDVPKRRDGEVGDSDGH